MAKEEKPEASEAEAAAEPKGPSTPKGPLIIALVNTLAVLGVLGLLVYTRIMFKRPAITEQGERARLAMAHASPVPPAAPGLIQFEPITVNIEPTPSNPKPADGTSTQIQGKLHYVNVGFALEVRDSGKKDSIENIRPVLMDRMLTLLGKKGFDELTTVQGRYVLRTQILEVANQLASQELPGSKDALVTNVFFTQFIVQ